MIQHIPPRPHRYYLTREGWGYAEAEPGSASALEAWGYGSAGSAKNDGWPGLSGFSPGHCAYFRVPVMGHHRLKMHTQEPLHFTDG